ncbi:MAG: aminopeptidase [Clostridia bacterium]|nr:aminopeptidase [Clostridia bacterium]MBQ7121335.1 aminopeptidase [Clostridia bacterium]
MSEKTQAEILKEELFYAPDHASYLCDEAEIAQADDFCEGYKDFLDTCKTEREAAAYVTALARNEGYVPFDAKASYMAGDKVYYLNRSKALILCTFGTESLENGVKIVASHIDSPRLDLKPNPLYEDSELAFFKTHYYGGIKKYQWTAIPLSLHGVICRRDGSSVTVNLGEDEGDPQFVVTDLLPHLDRKQASKPLEEAIAGENLNILVGSRPFGTDKGSEMVKLNIMKLLNEKYGITEADFLSAELEIVPAFKARDIGFDRSMIGSYGHDDRVCAYPSVMAEFAVKNPKYTTVTVITDKEETGSDGNTGLQSAYLKHFIADIAKTQGLCGRDVLRASECLSADVNAGFDPTYPSVHDKLNAAFINKGIVVTKYTGSRGKGGTSDANAEYMAKIRNIFDSGKVAWQTGELGKVDEGGGGTVAKYVANLGVEVVDVGVPVLSMHAPFEVVSKLDVYMAYKGFRAFLEQ